MDVSAISAMPAAATADPRTSSVAGRPLLAPAGGAELAPVLPPLPKSEPSPITVKIDQLPGGLSHTTLVDTRTGLPVLELPLASVVQFVDAILWRQRHAKDHMSASEGGTQ